MERRDGLSAMEQEFVVECKTNGKEVGRIFIVKATVRFLVKNNPTKILILFRFSINLQITIKFSFHTIFLTLLQIS